MAGKVTSLLCDLGYSSMQVDDPSRGFTYKADGPLDMRMDRAKNTLTAYEYLRTIPTASALAKVLRDNSDIEPSLPIAMALLGPHKEQREPPTTTTEFASRVRGALLKYHNCHLACDKTHDVDYTDKTVIDACIAKALQAIRIEVNGEFTRLEQLLHDLPHIMAPGGRVVFLTFHSGEDRRVKKALKQGTKSGLYSSWGRDVVLASSEERVSNPRSKSAKLRWAVRADTLYSET